MEAINSHQFSMNNQDSYSHFTLDNCSFLDTPCSNDARRSAGHNFLDDLHQNGLIEVSPQFHHVARHSGNEHFNDHFVMYVSPPPYRPKERSVCGRRTPPPPYSATNTRKDSNVKGKNISPAQYKSKEDKKLARLLQQLNYHQNTLNSEHNQRSQNFTEFDLQQNFNPQDTSRYFTPCDSPNHNFDGYHTPGYSNIGAPPPYYYNSRNLTPSPRTDGSDASGLYPGSSDPESPDEASYLTADRQTSYAANYGVEAAGGQGNIMPSPPDHDSAVGRVQLPVDGGCRAEQAVVPKGSDNVPPFIVPPSLIEKAKEAIGVDLSNCESTREMFFKCFGNNKTLLKTKTPDDAPLQGRIKSLWARRLKKWCRPLGAPNFQKKKLKYPNRGGQVYLWQFLMDLLLRPEENGNIISWIGDDGVFCLIDHNKVARKWGARKSKPRMNYDKFSRALRYYYEKAMLTKVPGKTYTYKFHLMGLLTMIHPSGPSDTVFIQPDFDLQACGGKLRNFHIGY